MDLSPPFQKTRTRPFASGYALANTSRALHTLRPSGMGREIFFYDNDARVEHRTNVSVTSMTQHAVARGLEAVLAGADDEGVARAVRDEWSYMFDPNPGYVRLRPSPSAWDRVFGWRHAFRPNEWPTSCMPYTLSEVNRAVKATFPLEWATFGGLRSVATTPDLPSSSEPVTTWRTLASSCPTHEWEEWVLWHDHDNRPIIVDSGVEPKGWILVDAED
jgi:hypothetical protein